MSLVNEKLNQFFKNQYALGKVNTGLQDLEESGVFDILMRLGVPGLADIKEGSVAEVMAMRGSYASGYHDALDYLRGFLSRFAPDAPVNSATVGSPDFNGTNIAIRNGDITKEDLEGKKK
jgi:hypothetical protein